MAKAAETVRVAVVDDHEIIVEGLKVLIERRKGIEWIGGFRNPEEFLAALPTLSADVILLDVGIPGMNGFEVMAAIRNQGLKVAVLFFTSHQHPLVIERARRHGAAGCLAKKDPVARLLDAIVEAATGKDFILSESLKPLTTDSFKSLSPKELEILASIAAGKTNKEIANETGLAVTTVITHRKRIMDKTGSHNAADLSRLAGEIGLGN